MLRENFPKTSFHLSIAQITPFPLHTIWATFSLLKRCQNQKGSKLILAGGSPNLGSAQKKVCFFSGKKRKKNVDLCQSSSHLYLINIFFTSKRQTQFMEFESSVNWLRGRILPLRHLTPAHFPPTGQCVTHDLHPHHHLPHPVSTSDVGCSAKFARTRRF